MVGGARPIGGGAPLAPEIAVGTLTEVRDASGPRPDVLGAALLTGTVATLAEAPRDCPLCPRLLAFRHECRKAS